MRNNRRKRQTSFQDTKLYDRVTQLETSIIQKLHSLRKNNKNLSCVHIFELEPTPQPYQSTQNYYQKFWKLFLSIELCREKIKLFEEDIYMCQNELQKIQASFERLEQIKASKVFTKTKIRRKSSNIEKQYECQFEGCYKSYGTEPALRLHYRQKHAPKSNQIQEV